MRVTVGVAVGVRVGVDVPPERVTVGVIVMVGDAVGVMVGVMVRVMVGVGVGYALVNKKFATKLSLPWLTCITSRLLTLVSFEYESCELLIKWKSSKL